MGVVGHVFGYGSLVDDFAGTPARLTGARRAWTVGMDNAVDVPGYKRYAAADGSRPPVVCFLDVVAAAGDLLGVCVPVDAAQLAVLDHRERNYVRVEVAARLRGGPGGPVWTYVGTAEARGRAARDSAVISRAYLARVEAAYAALGALEDYRATTDPPRAPIVDLHREDLPG